VFLSLKDLNDIETVMKIGRDEIIKIYCKIVDVGGSRRISLKEKDNYDCIFWSDGGCTIYEKRPLQCRSFPFWQTILRSEEEWENMKSHCPGIGKGTFHDGTEVRKWLDWRDAEPIITVMDRK